MSLAKKATLGALFSVGTSVFMRVIGLVGTLLLVRHLTSADYGEVVAASALVATAHQMSALGVGLFLVTNPSADRKVVFHANLIHVLLGVIALGGVVLLKEPLGPLFGAPGLAAFVPGLALAMFVERLGQVPEKLLVRELRFGTLALQRMLAEAAYTGVSVWLAMKGFGGMSIVWGNIARAIVKTVIIFLCVRAREWATPFRLDRRVIGTLVHFGLAISVGGLAIFAARRWDNLLMISAFGTDVGGIYALAYNLAVLPASQIGEQISDVLVASFPKVAPEKRLPALRRAVRVLAVLMIPMAIGLSLVSPLLAAIFLSAEWQSAGPFLLVLSFLSIPMPLCGSIFAYLQSFNRSWWWAITEWISVGAILGLLFLLTPFGPLAASAGVGIGFFVRYLLFLVILKRREGFAIWPFIIELLPPLLASGVMALAVVGARIGLDRLGLQAPLLHLIVESVVGALVYAGAALVVAPRASQDVLQLGRRVVERRRRPPTAAAA